MTRRSAFILAFAVSCGTNGPTSAELVPVPSTPPTFVVEVGTGFIEFEELADGQEVDLAYGPQGGFHIWTAVRVRDVTVGEAQINLLSRYEDGTSAGPPSRVAVPLVEGPGGTRAVTGLRNFIGDAAGARGKRIIFARRGDRVGATARRGREDRDRALIRRSILQHDPRRAGVPRCRRRGPRGSGTTIASAPRHALTSRAGGSRGRDRRMRRAREGADGGRAR